MYKSKYKKAKKPPLKEYFSLCFNISWIITIYLACLTLSLLNKYMTLSNENGSEFDKTNDIINELNFNYDQLPIIDINLVRKNHRCPKGYEKSKSFGKWQGA